MTKRRGRQFREQPPGETGRLLSNLRNRGCFEQHSPAHRAKRENYIRLSAISSDQGSVVVCKKAQPQGVCPCDPCLQEIVNQWMRPIAQVERRTRAIDDPCYFEGKVVASTQQRNANAETRIVFDTGFDNAPRMEEESSAPAHRVDLRGHFRRHPMPMNLPIETEMPEKTPAFRLRRSRPERVGVRPQGVHGCLPSASGADLLANRAQHGPRSSRGMLCVAN